MSETMVLPDRKQCPGGACPVCGCGEASVTETNGQDVVRCLQCDKYLYNAPRTETGRKERSVSTVHSSIKPKQRDRIITRANRRCERCGKSAMASATGIHVGHILSVAEGLKHGLTEEIINSDENLIGECDECNLGHGKGLLPVRLLVALLAAREATRTE
jgi:hypothetical protein